MKPSKEQIKAWAREVFGPSAYPLEGAIEMTNLAYAAGRKAGMEEAADMYSDALQADLEHGVKWRSAEAAKTFHKTYPELSRLHDAICAAMPDDLLRKLVAERGCVMVRRELLDDLRDDALQSAIANEHFKCHPTKDSRYAEPLARAIQVAAMLAAFDPRQQAQDEKERP